VKYFTLVSPLLRASRFHAGQTEKAPHEAGLVIGQKKHHWRAVRTSP
jgi:hypothetical protein